MTDKTDPTVKSRHQKQLSNDENVSTPTDETEHFVQDYSLVSLDWQADEEELRKIEENPPESLYPAIGDAIRSGLSSESLCRSFCGGKRCKYCCPVGRFPEDCFAIEGVYSHWVTSEILAMSRPSEEAIKKYNMIGQFKEHNIKSVFCVQVPNEHADCGLGLVDGYSYSQTELMRHGIAVYNLHWDDYSTPGFQRMLDIVRVMQFALTEGRLAMHCHAGLGRTGLAIACFLVFARRVSAAVAIAYLRQKRPGSVQSHAQVSGVREFAERLRALFILCPDRRLPFGHRFSYEEHMRRQRAILHGEAAKRLRRLSQVVHTICQRLQRLSATIGRARSLEAALAGSAESGDPPQLDAGGRDWRDRLNREGGYQQLLECANPSPLFAFLLCWLWGLKEPAVTNQHISVLLATSTLTGGLQRLGHFTATLLRYSALFLLRFCQPPSDGASCDLAGRHMDDLEEAVTLQLLSALTHTRMSPRGGDAAAAVVAGCSYPQFVKWFASFLDFTECLAERPGLDDYRVWSTPLEQLLGAPAEDDAGETAESPGSP